MAIIYLRCYGELNDFLPPSLRQRRFSLPYPPQTIRELMTMLAVPDPYVDLILVNGEAVDYGYSIKSQDRISIYPVFQSIDISPLKRLHPLN